MHIRFSTSRKRTARKKNKTINSRKRKNQTVRRATPSLSPPRKVYRKTPKVSAPTSAFAFTKQMSVRKLAPEQEAPEQAPVRAQAQAAPEQAQAQAAPEQALVPASNGRAIVYGRIYAKWCGACKALAPTWEKVAATVGGKSVDFSVEDVEFETKNAEFLKMYNIPLPPANGYPTIFKLRAKGGTPELYEDERSVEKLVEWILK
jgi:thiol-disulfide isomerase/thioredoxin